MGEPVRWLDRDRMLKFGTVGLTGVGVNSFFLWFFFEIVGFHLPVSSAIAIEISILSNFALNNLWTFGDRARDVPLLARLLKFNTAALVGLAINVTVLWSLTQGGLYYLVSNLIGILAAVLWNYTVSLKWTFR